MSINGLAGDGMILTVAILSTTLLNFSNVWMKEEIQSTRPIGLSVPLTTDGAVWTGPATVFIPKRAFFVTSSSRAVSTIVMAGVLSWSVGVSWFIRECSGEKTLDTSERTLGCDVPVLALAALVLISDGGSSGDVTTMEGNEAC